MGDPLVTAPPVAVIDPTANVIALVEANAKAAEKLREADTKYNDSQHKHLKEIGTLRAEHAELLRASDLESATKTRQVDVLAAAASAATLATAVQTLATNTDRNAETIRNQLNADRAALAKLVSDTAVNVSTQNDSLFKVVNTQIAELQKSQYQGVGKSSVADPMMAEFITEVRALAKSRATDTGQRQGMSDSGKLLVGALAIITTLLGFYTFTQRAAPASVAPQIIYVPAPAAGSGAPLPGTTAR